MYRFKPITLIAAIDSCNGIAKGGRIPWTLPQDLRTFKDVTMGGDGVGGCGKNASGMGGRNGDSKNAVIMGRKTWDAIPNRGLRDRLNVIISKTLDEMEVHADNATQAPTQLVRSFEDALKVCTASDQIQHIFIAGGSQVYQTALERGFVDHVHLTRIQGNYGCDTFLPPIRGSRLIRDRQYKRYGSKEVEIEQSSFIYSNPNERRYHNLLDEIIRNGTERDTRNARVQSIFDRDLKLNLQDGFPLLTTKSMFWRGIVEELLFFLRGDTNTQILSKRGVRIWEPNTSAEFLDQRGLYDYEVGDMGPMYGWNWRRFGADYSGMNHDYEGHGFDQLRDLLYQLKFNPTSRRMLLTTYDPSKVPQSVLAPCHGLVTQFYVENETLHCKMYQRSADIFLGLPFNIASYALLMEILCHVTNYQPGTLSISLGDCHLYHEHTPHATEQLKRSTFRPPQLSIRTPFIPIDDCAYSEELQQSIWVISALRFIQNLTYDDFELTDYRYHAPIPAPMIA